MEFDWGNPNQGPLPLKQIIFIKSLDMPVNSCKEIVHPLSIIITILTHLYNVSIFFMGGNKCRGLSTG